jgi:hypothetical protein
MTAMLSAVGSHIYPEPSTISDSFSKAGASYRPVANITSDAPFVAELVENVNNVVVHSPTLIYAARPPPMDRMLLPLKLALLTMSTQFCTTSTELLETKT